MWIIWKKKSQYRRANIQVVLIIPWFDVNHDRNQLKVCEFIQLSSIIELEITWGENLKLKLQTVATSFGEKSFSENPTTTFASYINRRRHCQ